MMMLLAFMHQELLSVYFASTSPKELIYNIMCTVGGRTRRPPTERAWQASLTLRLGHMKSLTLYVRFIYGLPIGGTVHLLFYLLLLHSLLFPPQFPILIFASILLLYRGFSGKALQVTMHAFSMIPCNSIA